MTKPSCRTSDGAKMLDHLRALLPDDLSVGMVHVSEIPETLNFNTGQPPAARGWKNKLLRLAHWDLPAGSALAIHVRSSAAARVLRNEMATISRNAQCALELKLRGNCIYVLRRQSTPDGG